MKNRIDEILENLVNDNKIFLIMLSEYIREITKWYKIQKITRREKR